MSAFRRLIAQRHFAMLLCVAALLLKLVVPAGYMIGSERGQFVITVCTGTEARSMTLDVAGKADHDGQKDHGQAEMPCPFSGLSAATLPAIDPILLSVLIAFVMAVWLRPASLPALTKRAYLRPPLRGPPAAL